MKLLILAGVLIIIICFIKTNPKEGYYSDPDTYAASTAIGTLKARLNAVANNIDQLTKDELTTLEVISKLRRIMDTDKPLVFEKVVPAVKEIIEQLSKLQDEITPFYDMLEKAKIVRKTTDGFIEKLDVIKKSLDELPDT